jgi:hypothetical protein
VIIIIIWLGGVHSIGESRKHTKKTLPQKQHNEEEKRRRIYSAMGIRSYL